MRLLTSAKMYPLTKRNRVYGCDPLTLYDCCPTSDGASCVILAADHVVSQFTEDPVWIKSPLLHLIIALHDRPSITQLMATESRQTGIQHGRRLAEDVDIAEVHDCFTIAELFATEDLVLLNVAQVVILPRKSR